MDWALPVVAATVFVSPVAMVSTVLSPVGVTLEVADDGPGIPPGEIAVLQQGSETKLEHGSGIGLWLVHWFVAAMGGDIAFHEAGGTVVEVALERADSPASADTTESEPAEVADD